MSDPVPTSPACNLNAQACSVVILLLLPSSDKRCPSHHCALSHGAVLLVQLWAFTPTVSPFFVPAA